MMRYLPIGALFFTGLVLAGCAASGSTVHNHRRSHKQTFKTPLVRTDFDFQENDLGNTAHILYQVRYHCENPGCTSAKATLSFYLETGPNTVFLSDRSLSIYAGDKTYHWEKQKWQDIRNSRPVNGKIISVKLKDSVLRQIAESQKITGKLAGASFNWSYKNRKPVRLLLARLKKNPGRIRCRSRYFWAG